MKNKLLLLFLIFLLDSSYPQNIFRYHYNNNDFKLSINPNLGLLYKINGNNSGYQRWWGARIEAQKDNIFGYLDFRDIGEFGHNINESKFLTPERGYWINSRPENGIEYSDVMAGIKYNWDWGSISLEKSYLTWGSGRFGKLIVSDKAASFPFIQFKIKPIDWMEFEYFHGWLSSLVPDSIYFYELERSNKAGNLLRKKYKDKFIAANLLTFYPFNNLKISLGNSVIYSDMGLRPEYFIPFMLFKFQDHNAGRDNDYGSNGQLFADIEFSLERKYNFYSTLFIENASVREILKNDFAKTWFGYTFGVEGNDVLKNYGIGFNVEYTRINPWVYEHYIPTTTYKHLDFDLGHWIGQNADHLRIQLNYYPFPKLYTNIYSEWVRKGGIRHPNFAFDKNEDEFLYGPLRKDFYIGINAKYNLYSNLSIGLNYFYSEISDEDKIRTKDYLLGAKHNLYTSIILGY